MALTILIFSVSNTESSQTFQDLPLFARHFQLIYENEVLLFSVTFIPSGGFIAPLRQYCPYLSNDIHEFGLVISYL